MKKTELNVGDKIMLVKDMGGRLQEGCIFEVKSLEERSFTFSSVMGRGYATYEEFNDVFTIVEKKVEHITNIMYQTQSIEELKVIRNNKATIVILKDGTKGVSKCHDEDKYDEKLGLTIAYNRAKIKQLQKEVKLLCQD